MGRPPLRLPRHLGAVGHVTGRGGAACRLPSRWGLLGHGGAERAFEALGAGDDVDFEVAVQELNEGDVVLLCSDGLTNMLSDSEILDVVSARGPDLQGACRDLIAAANARGGRDNISAVLLRYTV